jgi:hypothetical protein
MVDLLTRSYSLLLVFLCVASTVGHSQLLQPARQTYATLPQSFEPNRGLADWHVDFISRGAGYEFLLTPTAADLQLSAPSARCQGPIREGHVRMKLLGANPHAHAVGRDPQVGKSNYLIGSNPRSWRTDIPHYGRVEYRNVYPGITVAYYGNNQQLEYDFVLRPGADPGRIALVFEGADRIHVDPTGDLVLAVGSTEIRQKKPVMYQDLPGGRKRIEGRYVDHGQNRIGFEVARHDTRKPLIIDPVLTFSTYFGGNGDDSGRSLKLDAAGNMYIAGKTGSTNFPGVPLSGAPPLNGSGTAAYVAKISAAGKLIFSTYISGTNDRAIGGAVAVDSMHNVYLAGATEATDFPTKNAIQSSYHGNFDGFVLELNSSGNALVYSTYLGGSGLDLVHNIEVDTHANAYITGSTESLDFPTANAAQPAYGGGGVDAFAAKISAGGTTLAYSTYIGGTGWDWDNGMAIDRSGYLYAVGDTSSTDFPVKNAFQSQNAGGTDGWVTKLDPTGSTFIYSTYIGGSLGDTVRGAKVDKAGNLHLTGTTSSLNFPVYNPIQPSYGGGSNDTWVAGFNPSGSALLYSTYLGGTGDDEGWDIALDAPGNVYIAGFTSSTDFPTVNPIQSSNAGGYDTFLTKINATGSAIVFSTYVGGGQNDTAQQLAVDVADRAYLTGNTSSTNFPTVQPLQSTFGGAPEDAFVSVIATCDFTLSPTGQTFGSGGGQGTITITTTPECGWYAKSNRSWIVITSAKSGVGSGSVSYSVGAYTPGQTLNGIITIGTQQFLVHRKKH